MKHYTFDSTKDPAYLHPTRYANYHEWCDAYEQWLNTKESKLNVAISKEPVYMLYDLAAEIKRATKAADAPKLMPYPYDMSAPQWAGWIGDPNIPDDGRMYGYNIEEIQAAAKKHDVKIGADGLLYVHKTLPGKVETVNITFGGPKGETKVKECDCYDRACHDGHAPWCATRTK